ncbi:hypothetical protein EDB87DRAFT_1671593 [Lactarius vividus]|nr:hypothetical protein EDB87DRAFT_1671593 [Lactarius vividus]
MRQKTPQEGSERGGLDDTKLIHISPDKEDDDPNGDWGSEGHQTDHNTNNKENDFDNKNTLDEEAETFDGNSTPIPAPGVLASVVVNPFAPAPLAMASHTSGVTNTLTTSNSTSVAQQVETVAAGEATNTMRISDTLTATPPALDDTSPSSSTRPRLTLKLAPRPRPLTTATATVSRLQRETSWTPRLHLDQVPQPVLVDPATKDPKLPTETDVVNIRLERAQHGANNEKKRKLDNKTPSASTKKQKTSAALATPSDGNSIRNVCMRRWNELQPGGQGLASDFEEYFKALTDVDKEPFKKEMRIIQLANRKAKAIAKTTVNPTPAN